MHLVAVSWKTVLCKNQSVKDPKGDWVYDADVISSLKNFICAIIAAVNICHHKQEKIQNLN